MAKQNIVTEERDIDPTWAGEILDRHYDRISKGQFIQRPVSRVAIDRYAMDMAAGNWKLIPDPITFDVDDNLINGQHRLEGVRQSGKVIRMMVSTGWPADKNGKVKLIDVMDGNKPRTIDQMLHLHGQACARNYTTTCRFLCRVAHATGRAPAITFSTMMWMMETLNLRNAIDRILAVATDHRDFQGRAVGPLAYYYTTAPKKAVAFAEALFNATATKGDAVWLYQNWLKQHPDSKTDVGLKAISACIKAWHTNEELKQIRISSEPLEWLALTNGKLREQIRAMIPVRNR